MKKLVLVDDTQSTLEITFEILQRGLSNIETKKFNKPEEALKHIQKHGTQLLITDVDMPNISGIDLMTRIKIYDITIPVIIMSGNHDYKKIALQLGAFYFLNKPFLIETLLTQAKNALSLNNV